MHQECTEFNGIQRNSIRIQPNAPNSLLYMGFVSFANVTAKLSGLTKEARARVDCTVIHQQN